VLRRVPQVRVHAVRAHRLGDRDDRAHALGVRDRQLEGDRGAQAEPEHVRPVDAQVVEQRDHVACQRGRGADPVDVGGAAVAGHLDADQPVAADQFRDEPGEAEVDVLDAAVQQYQRRALALHLVVHVQAVHVHVAARRAHTHQTPPAAATHRSNDAAATAAAALVPIGDRMPRSDDVRCRPPDASGARRFLRP
jgi:hypothetical protein